MSTSPEEKSDEEEQGAEALVSGPDTPDTDDTPADYEHGFPVDATEKVLLQVDARDALTEVFLIDWNLQRVPDGYGIGGMEVSVPPGLYKIRFKTATTVHDQLVEVPAGMASPIVVTSEPLEFLTPIPIPRNDERSRQRAKYVEQHARIIAPTLGSGSQIFLCVQSWRLPDLPPRDSTIQIDSPRIAKQVGGNPGRGVSLYSTALGKTIVDLRLGQYFSRDHSLACVNVEVEPGNFLLRIQTGAVGAFEVPLTTCRGWQTAIFIQSRPLLLEGKERFVPDGPHASILMFRIGETWQLDQASVRLIDQANWGVRQCRPILTDAQVQKMLLAKWSDPMLGISGAHLLLMKETKNWELITTVLTNLHSLIGVHPDLAALQLAVERQSQTAAALPDELRNAAIFPFPPMLYRSWQLVLNASANYPGVIPPGSFSESLIQELPRGDLWLCWRRTRSSSTLAKATSGLRTTTGTPGRTSTEDPSEQSADASSTTLVTAGLEESAPGESAASTSEEGETSDLDQTLKSLTELAQNVQRRYTKLVRLYENVVGNSELPEPFVTKQVINDAKKANAAYAKMVKVQDLASNAARLAGVQLPDHILSALESLKSTQEQANRVQTTILASKSAGGWNEPKTPLEHLIYSWQLMQNNLTPEVIERLSQSTGLPVATINATLDKLRG